jgi:PAS domain S-box-containing protein
MDKSETPTWKILLVDDDDDDFLLTKSLLNQAQGQKITLDWSPNYENGKAKLKAQVYDAVLVDYDLGASTGIQLIREAVTGGYPAPFILYTGRGSYQVDLEAMQAGAALYLTKGESGPLMLERAIRYAIERKQAESALKESRESYRQLFNAMLDGFALHEMIYDAEGQPVDYRFLEINPAFETLTGLKAADVVGRTLREVLPETEESWIKTYGEVASTGRSIRFERFHLHLGKYYEVVAFSPCQGQFAVIFTDITQRHRSEQALLSAQEELERRVQARMAELMNSNTTLESIFSGVNMLVALMDRDFYFIRVNEKYARADDHEPAFFEGKNHFELYPHPENEAIFRRVVETGEPFSIHAKPFEYIDHPERGVTYWDWSLNPIKEDGGRVTSLVLTLNEVTGHQRAEERLNQYAAQTQAMAALFEQLFQSSPEATLLVDAGGMIVRSNNQAEALFGFEEEELIGKPVEVLLPENIRSVHASRRSMFREHPKVQAMGEKRSYLACRKDGVQVPVEVTLSQVQIDGQLNVICVLRDLAYISP